MMKLNKRKINFQKLNFDALTDYVVFTDINLEKLDGNITIDENVMFQSFINKHNPFHELINFLSTFEKPVNVKKVLLLFLQCEFKLTDIEETFNKLKGKLNPELYVIGFPNDNDFFFHNDCTKLAKEYKIDFVKVEKDMKNVVDIFNLINHLLLEKLPSTYHNRDSALNYLKTRFQTDAGVSEESDGFTITTPTHRVRFKTSNSNSFLVYDISKNLNSNYLFIVTNVHLFGLYSLEHLDQSIKSLHEIREKVVLKIENDEVVLNQSSTVAKLDVPVLFQKLITEFDRLSVFQNFKIQLCSESCLVFNRCLKVSLSVLELLLQNNVLESFIQLAFLYFKCFSIPPVCCRMQSLSFDAKVFDFEKYTYLHLEKNCVLYVKIYKLLYPFVVDVDEELLNRNYLEVIPVTLIGRFRGKKLEAFVEKLQTLQDMNFHLLPNGSFQIGSYFNVSAEMLIKPFDIEKMKKVVESLEPYSNTQFSLCPLYECLEFESKILHEVKNTNIINLHLQRDSPSFNINAAEIFAILTYEQHQIVALKINCSELLLEIDEVVVNACKEFSEAFGGNVNLSLLPFYNSQWTLLKQLFFVNVRIGYFNNGYSHTWQRSYDDDKIWVYKERFYFSKPFSLAEIDDIVNEMLSFERDEGICLAFIKNRIVTAEDMDMAINELDPDNYKTTADYCYYNEDEILKFCYKLLEVDIEDLYFEITSFGSIKFLTSVEIFPSTFLKIKNIPKLLEIIKKLCKLFDTENHPKFSLGAIRQKKATSNLPKHTDDAVIRLAKLLNPSLNVIENDDIFALPLVCIPEMFYRNPKMDDVINEFEYLRSKNIRIRVCGNSERFLFDSLEGKDLSIVIPNIHRLLEIVEEINSSFDGVIVMKEFFSVVDYDNFEKKVFCLSERKENMTTEQLMKCLELFKQNPVNHVAIVDNEFFHINTVLYVAAIDFLQLAQEHLNVFHEAVDIITKQREAENVFIANRYVSLTIEDGAVKQVKLNKRFENFTVIDDNRSTYIQLVETFNDCLCGNSDVLYKYKWLNALPQKMLINRENASKLLDYLNYVKKKGYHITLFNDIGVRYCGFSVSKWLAIKDIDKLVKAINWIYTTNTLKLDSRKFSLFSSGLLSWNPRKKSYMLDTSSKHQKMIEKRLKNSLTYMKENEIDLTITLNSGANIMIGNFIWLFLDEIELIQNEILKFVNYYEMAVEEEERDVMRSICDLTEKEKAILLAKTLNKNLTYFDDNLICHRNLKVFPTALWKACNDNPETYETAMTVFQKLEESKLSWFIKLNGLVQLGSSIVVPVTSILKLNENLKKKFSMISQLNKILKHHLICEENIKYEQYVYRKEYQFNALLVENCTKQKKDLKYKKIKCRIGPNGIFLINDNLWTTPSNANEVVEISEILKDLFPNEKFMYSNPGINFVTTVFTAPAEQIYQYCYNLCKYVNKMYPNVSITYHAGDDLFKFNEVLLIHPRSFFHLQNMEKVVAVLKKFKVFKDNYDNLQNEEKTLSKKVLAKRREELKTKEKAFCKELWEIKKEERVETDYIREKCFNRISAVIRKPNTFNRLKTIGNIKEMDANKPFYGLENIKIRGEFIFKNGNTNGFINVVKDNGTTKFAYKNKKVVEAIEMAGRLDGRYKCKNLSDFQSLVEILTSYDSFCRKRRALNACDMPKDEEKKQLHEKINWWLEKVQKQQDRQRKYKYGNALKGLHHWFKHPEGFKNLEHLYQELNTFFETTDYNIELDTQNGKFFNRRYSNDKYFGVYIIASEENADENIVATFWCTEKQEKKKSDGQEKFNFSSSKTCSKYLIITDTEFSNFTADEKVELNNEISVKTISKNMPTLFLLKEQIVRGVYQGSENVQNILLFLTDTVKNENVERVKNKEDTERDYKGCLEDLQISLKEKFANAKDIIFCYVDDTDAEIVSIIKEIENEQFKLQEIDEFLLEDKDAENLKEFLESTLD